jgi:hypothetical protein
VILTANYTFLNYLVLSLGFLLLDDKFLLRFVPARFRPREPERIAGAAPERRRTTAFDSGRGRGQRDDADIEESDQGSKRHSKPRSARIFGLGCALAARLPADMDCLQHDRGDDRNSAARRSAARSSRSIALEPFASPTNMGSSR